MSESSTLNKNLQTLNSLLMKERMAIIHLQMSRLEGIRQEKIAVLKLMHQDEKVIDQECAALIDKIKINNDRNRILLQSGLRLINRMQANVFRRLALTYAPEGMLNIRTGSRIFNRRV
ncbi:MAG: hypothetical protein JZU65_13045 [Chlorobium sp.]|jgi:hypothetical protein|nr:hypothetical protein [Chlorobium sp.]